MHKLSVTLFLVAAVACGDNKVIQSASGVFPAQGFTGRALRVELSGDQTDWADGATVTFGDGVTVTKTTVESPTNIFVEIAVDPAATVGARDVTITSNGTFTLASAFELVAPIELTTKGKLAQGSLFTFKLVNKDFDNPFDTTTVTDPLTGATTFPNLVITGPTGVALQSPLTGGLTAAAYELDGLALIDVDATGGAVTIASGDPAGKPVMSVVNLDVAARTATSLTAGSAQQGTLAAAFDSDLYTMTGISTPPEFARFTLSATTPSQQPFVAILGGSGHWATDFLGTGNTAAELPVVDASAASLFAIVTDLAGDSGVGYSLTPVADHLTVQAAPTAGTNATVQTAFAATGQPWLQTGGALTTATSVDFIKFVAAATDAGKKFHVSTAFSTDPCTELVVDLQTSNNQVIGTGQGGAGFFGCAGASVIATSAIPAGGGTFFIKVASGQFWTSADTGYTLVFWLE